MSLFKHAFAPALLGLLLLGLGGCSKSPEGSAGDPGTPGARLAKPLVSVDGKRDDWGEQHHVFGMPDDYRLYIRNDARSLYLFHQLSSNDIERLRKEPVPQFTQLYFDTDNDGTTGSGSAFMTMTLFGGGGTVPRDHPESSTGFEYRLTVGSDRQPESENSPSVYCSITRVADITPARDDVEPTGTWRAGDAGADSEGRIAVSADAVELMVPIQLESGSTIRILLLEDVEGVLNKHEYFFTYSAT